MENILVAGANGTTGKMIVDLLQESQDFKPVAMVRKEEQKAYFTAKNIETVLVDLERDVSPSFDTNNPIDKVVFAAGSGGKKVQEVDQDGAIKLIDESKKQGVKKFIMLSSMGADTPEQVPELKDYLVAKQNADNHLKQSGLPYCIVRPGALTNDAGSETIALELKLNKQGKISRSDVAKTLVQTLNTAIANQVTFEIIKGQTPIDKAIIALS